jgi:hypothetical protein
MIVAGTAVSKNIEDNSQNPARGLLGKTDRVSAFNGGSR